MTVLRRLGALVGIITLALVGCSKTGADQKGAPSASDAPDASIAIDAGPPPEDPAKPRTFSGTYSASPASIYISSEKPYAKVKQAKDDPSVHVGEGSLSITIEPDGKVTGSIASGPAAPAVIDGTLFGDEVRGNVRRKDPSDDGLTGTFAGTMKSDTLDGNLSLADANAGIVREGKLSLAKK